MSIYFFDDAVLRSENSIMSQKLLVGVVGGEVGKRGIDDSVYVVRVAVAWRNAHFGKNCTHPLFDHTAPILYELQEAAVQSCSCEKHHSFSNQLVYTHVHSQAHHLKLVPQSRMR
jgi:hypothetical protein